MPLDQRGYATPELQIIDKVIERLSDPANWCKKALVKGNAACLAGTAYVVAGSYSHCDGDPRRVVVSVIKACTSCDSIIDFNDAPSTTHADVMAVLHRARALILDAMERDLRPIRDWTETPVCRRKVAAAFA
jgi:hypothetical protein